MKGDNGGLLWFLKWPQCSFSLAWENVSAIATRNKERTTRFFLLKSLLGEMKQIWRHRRSSLSALIKGTSSQCHKCPAEIKHYLNDWHCVATNATWVTSAPAISPANFESIRSSLSAQIKGTWSQCVAMLCWNKALTKWLASRSYATPKFMCDIGSSNQFANKLYAKSNLTEPWK